MIFFVIYLFYTYYFITIIFVFSTRFIRHKLQIVIWREKYAEVACTVHVYYLQLDSIVSSRLLSALINLTYVCYLTRANDDGNTILFEKLD